MPVDYPSFSLLHTDAFADLSQWHHEGVGSCELIGGGMRLICHGSKQGAEGCMAFFRAELPDQIAIEYDIVVHHHGGLVINYIALRGLKGEDALADVSKLPARTGVMSDYWSEKWGLQSYHVSFSRFGDDGKHTQTSNWRKNPGCLLIGHGVDPVQEIGRSYHIRVVKDAGHCQLFVDGKFAHGFIDHDKSGAVPDHGKFGFRLIGSNVAVDVRDFKVTRIVGRPGLWQPSVLP